MSLGLPGHLVQATLSRALARASHWYGLICLIGALVSVLALSMFPVTDRLQITIAAILGMGALLALLARWRTVPLTLAYLILGAACVYLYTSSILGMPDVFPSSDMFLIALPKMALIMVGGAGSGALIGVLWSTAGFVLAEAAATLAVAQTTVPDRPDLFTIVTYLILVGVMLLDGLTRRTGRAAQPAIHRAVQDDQSRILRHDFDVRAIALMHDTTLNQLVSVARAKPGPLSRGLEAGLRETLQTLAERDWLTHVDERTAATPAGSDGWLASAVFRAIDRSRDRGLVVDITGDKDALGRLDPESDRELGLAVQQCLVNVLLHAGIATAEVVIDADDQNVSVMVLDAGRGFMEAETGSDRLGLRQSVRKRIERLGGSVVVWSRPGAGTSVLLTLPAPVAAPASGEVAP
ncbi:sensor histidine kinase [Cryobacterium arcticum]|uniref:ATP-binding protein n=1 Tax=Cryobacterium arcticum TaxID=670052 RepID=A0A317ZVZ0_9MICO|nr:ATP-binding protein [Cryobacterium arcticum]PXA69981.1 ATP-binding protein [Cryobacterium arcticum]